MSKPCKCRWCGREWETHDNNKNPPCPQCGAYQLEEMSWNEQKKRRTETDRLVERIGIAKNLNTKITCLTALCLHLQSQLDTMEGMWLNADVLYLDAVNRTRPTITDKK